MSEPLCFSDVPALINIGQPVIISWSGSDGSFANLTLCEDRYDADSHVSNFVPVKIIESEAIHTPSESSLWRLC